MPLAIAIYQYCVAHYPSEQPTKKDAMKYVNDIDSIFNADTRQMDGVLCSRAISKPISKTIDHVHLCALFHAMQPKSRRFFVYAQNV